MRVYKEITQKYLSPRLRPWRKARDMTQEDAAELLRMSSRAYADLERGESGFSATTLLLFLAQLSDSEIVELVRAFLKEVLKKENQEAA
ncbi:MAG: helix-turn-helix transcriptional regulator [Oscillibacter sp.]|nr:helix-turn-helix transcriptional regulator [Oscillibacter sp.]